MQTKVLQLILKYLAQKTLNLNFVESQFQASTTLLGHDPESRDPHKDNGATLFDTESLYYI